MPKIDNIEYFTQLGMSINERPLCKIGAKSHQAGPNIITTVVKGVLQNDLPSWSASWILTVVLSISLSLAEWFFEWIFRECFF